MRKLVWDASFKRAFRQLARHDPTLPALKTHKLRGQLAGSWACWVEYDCRIIFTFEADPSGGEDMIVLVDIGTHDEVY
jgi:mRNA-degrading endonuclease YafQ of YafQ-DinJ toxin-antitoxin module